MHSLTVADVLRILTATDDPELHIRKVFEWQIDRTLTLLRIAGAAVGAILVAVLAAAARDDLAPTKLGLLAIGLGLLFSVVNLVDQYGRARTLEREYVAALGLLRELTPLVPLLRLYGVPDGV